MIHKKKILIVEDEVMIAMCLEREFLRAGYEVCKRLARGEDAVQTAEKESPSCIIIDIGLAGSIDGIETARIIKEKTDTAIIFLTGYPDKALEERALELKPLGYFTKPVRAETLIPVIESLNDI